MLGGGVAAQTW